MNNDFTHCNKRRIPQVYPFHLSRPASLLCLLAASALAGCGSPIDANIGGTVTGLAANARVGLLDNGGDALTVSANGTFTFPTKIEAPNAYNVTVATQPTGETCTVSNGSGTVSQNAGDVTNITVSCYSTPTGNQYVLGTVVGLAAGAHVILLDNGGDNLTVTGTASGTVPFEFQTALTVGASYSVTVGTNPSGATCTVSNNGSGTIPASGTTSVVVSC
ncbi:MAG TPA: hypothetical protein VNW52_04815 [Burkholderiaceae bacterium]|jgi:hypothetical protein|nr:hypothetical protein [Burkholderiaceae bacterium]